MRNVLGVMLAAAATRVLSSLLYGLSPTDPVTYAVIGATLIAVALPDIAREFAAGCCGQKRAADDRDHKGEFPVGHRRM